MDEIFEKNSSFHVKNGATGKAQYLFSRSFWLVLTFYFILFFFFFFFFFGGGGGGGAGF